MQNHKYLLAVSTIKKTYYSQKHLLIRLEKSYTLKNTFEFEQTQFCQPH